MKTPSPALLRSFARLSGAPARTTPAMWTRIRLNCLISTLVLFLAALPSRVSAIVYLPPEGTSMWDTWMFSEGKDIHLFYLRSEIGKRWNSIGHAVSQDWVHWKELPPIPTQGAEGIWDHKLTLTGCTIKRGDTYYLFYGAANRHQQVGVMTSRDLVHWEKHPGNPILESGPPHYGDGFDWRDLHAFYDATEERWHGLICARVNNANSPPHPSPRPHPDSKHGQPAIGHLVSSDLIRWEQQPPLFTSWQWGNMEVPDYFTMGGRHYILFSHGGSMPETSGRKQAGGTFYVMAEKREGPYRIPGEPLLLGWGRNRLDNYVGRTILHQGTLMLYHHTCGGPISDGPTVAWQPGKGGPVTWGAPKTVQQRQDGSLWLKYWPGMDKLERRVLFDGPPPQGAGNDPLLWLPITATDLSVALRFTVEDPSPPLGLVWRWNGQRGGTVMFHPLENKIEIGELRDSGNGPVKVEAYDEYLRVPPGAGERQIRVLVRGHRTEVYLDEQWVFSTPTPENGASGKVGLSASGKARVRNIRVAELKPF